MWPCIGIRLECEYICFHNGNLFNRSLHRIWWRASFCLVLSKTVWMQGKCMLPARYCLKPRLSLIVRLVNISSKCVQMFLLNYCTGGHCRCAASQPRQRPLDVKDMSRCLWQTALFQSVKWNLQDSSLCQCSEGAGWRYRLGTAEDLELILSRWISVSISFNWLDKWHNAFHPWCARDFHFIFFSSAQVELLRNTTV